MDVPRVIAGVFTGFAAMLLIYQEHYEPAIALISGMMGFFVGEKNGQKAASVKAASA